MNGGVEVSGEMEARYPLKGGPGIDLEVEQLICNFCFLFFCEESVVQSPRRFTMAAALILACGMAWSATGEEREGETSLPRQTQAVQPVHPGNPVLLGGSAQVAQRAQELHELKVSLEFKGGTVDELVRAIQVAAGSSPVNVLYSRAVGDIEVPPMKLKDAPVFGALHSLSRIAISKEVRNIVVNLDSEVITIWVPIHQHDEISQQQEEMVHHRVEAVSIRDLVESSHPHPPQGSTMAVEAVLKAVTQALEMLPPERSHAPKITFQKEGCLLLVSGSMNQISTVVRTVDALRLDLKNGYIEGNRLHKLGKSRDLVVRPDQPWLEQAKTEFAIALQRVDEAEVAFAEASGKHNEGLVTAEQLKSVQDRLEQARHTKQKAVVHLRRAHDAEKAYREAVVNVQENPSDVRDHDQKALSEAITRLELLIGQMNELLQKLIENAARDQ